ncbi:signal recognition particle, SRP19 subunit [Rhizodiscina lignyota]|uniref:Signal recognition particle, SRP19 subunit n=1 Tax=Rhizodiscina lignyota TaxID=1504668 RepID=A0A9P4IPR5_9PEZI|nr:signal recognition particle, SRP19 subunit [Rhizodiscina lignyota]
MAHHARIEEVSDSDSDSDPSDMDPSDFDPPPLASNSIISPSSIPSTQSSRQEALQPTLSQSRSVQPDPELTKSWHCLYPVYFDSSRTRHEGRRVSKNMGVPNPLAREIVDAVAGLGVKVAFEPGKTHPKDWGNPGRVKVFLKEPGSRHVVKNKHHLYILVSTYLKAHPTTENSPLRLRIAGMPAPKGAPPPPEIPRGWKMGTVLPLHSPAVTGGGVSENFFKDMMAEMQGQAEGSSGGGGGGSGGEAKKKKDKKKVKA